MQDLLYKIYPTHLRLLGGRLKARRLRAIQRLAHALQEPNGKKILEAGCANGKDFLSFVQNRGSELYGIDITDIPRVANCKFQQADIENLPFDDKFFDLVVSFGVLEHIVPIDKLDRCIKEINRVAKQYVIVVPANGTIIEPHTGSLFWQIRSRGHKEKTNDPLNYYSDESWLSFDGFRQANIKTFWYIPGLIKNLIIHN